MSSNTREDKDKGLETRNMILEQIKEYEEIIRLNDRLDTQFPHLPLERRIIVQQARKGFEDKLTDWKASLKLFDKVAIHINKVAELESLHQDSTLQKALVLKGMDSSHSDYMRKTIKCAVCDKRKKDEDVIEVFSVVPGSQKYSKDGEVEQDEAYYMLVCLDCWYEKAKVYRKVEKTYWKRDMSVKDSVKVLLDEKGLPVTTKGFEWKWVPVDYMYHKKKKWETHESV